MAREYLSLYDTTLRDGAQTYGVDFSVEDKWLIAEQLDVLGIDYIEGGYPGANPTDTRLFAESRELSACAADRVRHDQARRAGRLPTIPASRRCSPPRRLRSASSARPGISMSTSRSASLTMRMSRASGTRSRPWWRAGARRCSTASISSTATRPIPTMRSAAPRPPMRPARAGSCCATPMAARCPRRSKRSSPRW